MSKDNEALVQDMSIQAAAEKWPDSKSRAFYVNGNESSYYFLTTQRPERGRNKTIKAIATCVKLHIPSNTLTSTKLVIKVNTAITAITFKEYLDKIHEAMRKLQEEGNQDALNNFKIWQFSLKPYKNDKG